MISAKRNASIARRDFIKASALAGGGLLLSAVLPTRRASAAAADAVFKPNFYIQIAKNGLITIVSKNPEIGQGIKTSLPMIIAEELEAPWESVKVEQVGYVQGLQGWQGAGGSGATPGHYDLFRKTGAVGRAMLVAAAAETWGVPASECQADQGYVRHTKSKKRLAYGDLVEKAATLETPDPDSVPLKDPKDFKLLGRRITGVDNHEIVTGKPLFGIDQQREGMLHAAFVRCPVFGRKARTANLDTLKRMTGVVDAFILEGTDDRFGLQPGIAIVAKDTWTAFKAQQSLQALWDDANASEQNSLLYRETALGLAEKTGQELRRDGDVDAALQQADHVVEATYEYPFLSHTNLEPQNTTALFHDGVMEIWSPTQNPGSGHGLIKNHFNLPDDKVVVHMTRIGGGFGRRLMSDFMIEAAAIAHRFEGTPIKLTWTREQDMRHDYYRAAGWHHFKGAVAPDGKVAAWADHFVTFGLDSDSETGRGAGISSDEFPIRWVENALLAQSVISTNVPMGWWRAPGSCAIAWAVQGFIDELAVASQQDPMEFRLALLGPDRVVEPADRGVPYDTQRMKNVVRLAAEKAGWGKSLPRGKGQGIAFHFSHRGYVAVVAEVTVTQNGSLSVDRLVAGVDVGPIVNLSGAENQVEGSMLDAFNAAYQQEITIENGRVRQSNFDDNPMLRISESPPIVETHFHQSDNPPTGLGEPAFPPTTPAITNAIFAACGKRVRTLPLSKVDLSWS